MEYVCLAQCNKNALSFISQMLFVCLSFLLRRARHQSLYINFIRTYFFFFCLSRPDCMTSSYNFCILLSAFYHRVSLPRENMRECVLFLYTNECCAGSRLWYKVLRIFTILFLISLSLLQHHLLLH